MTRRAAGGKDVALAGGARLFDDVGALHSLAIMKTVQAPNVIHLKFVRKKVSCAQERGT